MNKTADWLLYAENDLRTLPGNAQKSIEFADEIFNFTSNLLKE